MIDEQLKEIIEKEIKSLSGNFEPDHKLTLIKKNMISLLSMRPQQVMAYQHLRCLKL